MPVEIRFTPIGTISTPYSSRYSAPRQPATAGGTVIGEITLDPGRNFEQALADLEGFEYIWVIFWFDRNRGWKPKVLPPDPSRTKRGVFATRSPHRPNAIGLSLCRLRGVKGRKVTVENPDMLNGTPVLDIKPYLPHAESFPDAKRGWMHERTEDARPSYRVVIAADVRRALSGLPAEEREELEHYLMRVLARDPQPHAYRRIKRDTDGSIRVAVRKHRFRCTLRGRTVTIVAMTTLS
jgi:tRNA-Thr(GGU) m(6)t(6)A37 methyltransferase TsaA